MVRKNFLNHIYFSTPIVKELFMKLPKDNSWDEEDDHDNRVLLKLEN